MNTILRGYTENLLTGSKPMQRVSDPYYKIRMGDKSLAEWYDSATTLYEGSDAQEAANTFWNAMVNAKPNSVLYVYVDGTLISHTHRSLYQP